MSPQCNMWCIIHITTANTFGWIHRIVNIHLENHMSGRSLKMAPARSSVRFSSNPWSEQIYPCQNRTVSGPWCPQFSVRDMWRRWWMAGSSGVRCLAPEWRRSVLARLSDITLRLGGSEGTSEPKAARKQRGPPVGEWRGLRKAWNRPEGLKLRGLDQKQRWESSIPAARKTLRAKTEGIQGPGKTKRAHKAQNNEATHEEELNS